ncbi:heme NO-binding domain-containing protein [Parathalassolituus penaei]|uniref:Heme NO-binding domain-containing protein n=1 Tax=Parathalassolituus penaei TaxID=2997323 RepID=A0A9X3ITI4_9GAMM|nr:heme NO-binding domain-containing protein [Parathalassolituus penaei]MCY0966350.1 heme NO-binding domain-containing protein [Parathalassolituus penaei]
MLGMIFTELVEMIETRFSPELADEILSEANFHHGGAYTAVGYYDFSEIVTLVSLLSQKTNIPVTDLIQAFGKYLFESFTRSHSKMLAHKHSLFSLLETLDQDIHREVRKLYSAAQLPSFRVVSRTDHSMELEYRSKRHLEPLAIGLIEGAAEFYGLEKISITLTPCGEDATLIQVHL